MSRDFFAEEDVVSRYTSEDAVEDGILYDLDEILPAWLAGGFVRYITIGVGSMGYVDVDEHDDATVNAPNLMDLLVQAEQIRKRGRRGDWHYSGEVETPDGEKQEIYIEQNETGRFTILLPSEH